jgi:hypothetical protein
MPVRYVSCATYPCTVDKNVTPRGPVHHVRTLGLTEIHQRMDPFLQGAHGPWIHGARGRFPYSQA